MSHTHSDGSIVSGSYPGIYIRNYCPGPGGGGIETTGMATSACFFDSILLNAIDEVQMVQRVPYASWAALRAFRTSSANKRSKYPWPLYSIEIQLLSCSNDGREIHNAMSGCM